jgi:hypothetical protein
MSTPPSLIVLLFCASLSVACTLLTLYIIKAINRWNGYIQLIFNLALAQLVYDASMVFIPLRRYYSFIEWTYIAIRCISGLVATSFTNILASVVVYAVWKRSTYDINKTLVYAKPIIIIPSIIIGSMVSISMALEVGFIYWSYAYGFLRALSIVINIVLYIVLTCTLYLRNRNSPNKNDPLEVLVNRFKYYPLVQVVSRVAVTIHELKYGFEYYNEDGSSSLQEKISLYFYVTTLPSLGALYFLVFLSVSPGAYTTLKLAIRRMASSVCCWVSPPEVDNSSQGKEGAEQTADKSFRGSSFCSENSNVMSDMVSDSLDDVLLSDDDIMSEGSGGMKWKKYMISTASGLDFKEIFQSRRSTYDNYDEEDLILEIDKLFRESTIANDV